MKAYRMACVAGLWLMGCGETEMPMEDPPVIVDPIVERNALEAFVGCMKQTVWNETNMTSWATKGSEGGVVCESCHGDGGWNFLAVNDPTVMFTRNRYEVFVRGFFAVDPITEKVVPATEKLEGKGSGTGVHPTFGTGQSDEHFQALATFVQRTNQAEIDGTCGLPGFPTP